MEFFQVQKYAQRMRNSAERRSSTVALAFFGQTGPELGCFLPAPAGKSE